MGGVGEEDLGDLEDELEGQLDSEAFIGDSIDEWSLDCELDLTEDLVLDFAEYIFARHGGS